MVKRLRRLHLPRPTIATARDILAIAGVGAIAIGAGMLHPALPWFLVGGYLVLVARVPEKRGGA